MMNFEQILKDPGVLYYLVKYYANIKGLTTPYIFLELFKKIKRHSAPLIKLESLHKH